MPTRSFVYRADRVFQGHDVYLVIPDRGDAPAMERVLQSHEGSFLFVAPPEEILEIVDDQEQGLAVVRERATLPLCIGDTALASDGAHLGLPACAPTASVVRTATAAVLTAAWGAQALAIPDPEVFMRVVEASRLAAAISPERASAPLHLAFTGSTNNRHLSSHSTLIEAPLPSGEPGLLLALHAADVDAIEAILAERRYSELHTFDFIHVAFKRAPAFATRLFGVLHGFSAVPIVSRAAGGAYILLSSEDLLTIAGALEVYALGTTRTVVAGDLEVTARALQPQDFPRAVPEHVERVSLPEVPDEAFQPDGTLLAAWDDYFAAACHAAVGELSEAYEKLLALFGSPDPRVRDLSIEAAMRVNLKLPMDELDRITAAAHARDMQDPRIRANIERNEALAAEALAAAALDDREPYG